MVEIFDFGTIYEGSFDLILVKLILFSLTLILTNFVLRKSLDTEKIPRIIVSVAISILTVAFTDIELITSYLLPSYGLFGIVAIAILPFFLFFFFIESFDFPLLRKFGLTMIGIFYFIIGYYRMDKFVFGSSWWQDVSWIYFSIAIISVLIVIFEKPLRKFIFYRR